MSICFANSFPMSNETFGNTTDSKSKTYSKYLQGDVEFNDNFWMSLFGRNNWNISDYLKNITVFHYLKDEKHTEAMETFSSLRDCPFITFENNFQGFNNGSFGRCFEMKVKEKYSRYVSMVFLGFKNKFENIARQSQYQAAFVRFSYPGQLLLDFIPDEYLWKYPSDRNTIAGFNIDSVEILRKRNKKTNKCLEDSINFDSFWLKQVIRRTGCKAPYHNLLDDIKICNDFEKLAIFDLFNFLHEEFIPPCEETPHLSFKPLRNEIWDNFGLYPIVVKYPRKFKMITQQQALDIHALIGNIGGYIGLFLGLFEFSILPLSILHV